MAGQDNPRECGKYNGNSKYLRLLVFILYTGYVQDFSSCGNFDQFN